MNHNHIISLGQDWPKKQPKNMVTVDQPGENVSECSWAVKTSRHVPVFSYYSHNFSVLNRTKNGNQRYGQTNMFLRHNAVSLQIVFRGPVPIVFPNWYFVQAAYKYCGLNPSYQVLKCCCRQWGKLKPNDIFKGIFLDVKMSPKRKKQVIFGRFLRVWHRFIYLATIR